MIISIEEKTFVKNQTPFQNENTQHKGIQLSFLNLTKDIYEKPSADNMLNVEKLDVFFLRSETRWGCQFSPFIEHCNVDSS